MQDLNLNICPIANMILFVFLLKTRHTYVAANTIRIKESICENIYKVTFFSLKRLDG